MSFAVGEPPYKIVTHWHWKPNFRRWFLEDDDKLVRVKSWRASWGEYGVEWPVLLIDRRGGGRETVWPCWTWGRLISPWRDVECVWTPVYSTANTTNWEPK